MASLKASRLIKKGIVCKSAGSIQYCSCKRLGASGILLSIDAAPVESRLNWRPHHGFNYPSACFIERHGRRGSNAKFGTLARDPWADPINAPAHLHRLSFKPSRTGTTGDDIGIQGDRAIPRQRPAFQIYARSDCD